jgi:pimeloyl-ACP methyl ester carboxylesterase
LKKTEATTLTTVPVRTLAITGEDDGCMDTRLYDHVFVEEDFPKGVRVERIEHAGHFTHQERPEEVNRMILAWLEEF